MATATAQRFTKPRLSALILEGTTAIVALILLLWLLLWFMRPPSPGQIQAFFVPAGSAFADEVPYQSTDVRLLRGSPTSDDHWETKPSELLEAVRPIISRDGPPALIYVNEPVVRSDPGTGDNEASMEPVISLIKLIAEKSQRDVVLALDLAQIDSDRDLGVFGNSPYQGLAEQISALPPGKRNFLILTPCAPAQKSWSTDGLGQSAFSYYLRKGLEGDARNWDRNNKEVVTAEGLHRYVRAYVSAWAKRNCRAIQTPMLIPVGKSVGQVTLPILPSFVASRAPAIDPAKLSEPASPSTPDEKAQAKDGPAAKAKENTVPPEQDRELLLKEVLSEWKEHARLQDQKPSPYRYLPGAWRYYQFTLLQAERRLRAAWLDRDRLNLGWDALKSARNQRKTIEGTLKQQGDAELEFPFHPAITEERKKEIAEALAHLTRVPAGVVPGAPPQPAQAAAGIGNQPLIPRCLSDISEGDYPRHYLELQLPVWANRFTELFRVPDYFRKFPRSEHLRRLVEERSKAENALALDHRGLRYVEPIVASGDAIRRQLQDRLFAREGAQPGFGAREINSLERTYEAALSVIQAFHEAREVLEQIAAELPELAEWNIRRRSHELTANRAFPDDLMPDPVDKVIDQAQKLTKVLDQEIPRDQGANRAVESIREWANQLKNCAVTSADAFRELQDAFREGTRPDFANDWITRDLALRSPLLPPDQRTDLLRKVLESNSEVRLSPDEGSSEISAENPPDPGFWIRAAGLTGLDLALGQVGRGALGEREPQFRRLKEIWPSVRSSAENPTSLESLFQAFSDFSKATRKSRDAAVFRADQARNRDRTLDETERVVRLEDRVTRFLCVGEIRQRGATTIDEPVAAYEKFGRYVTLSFHRRRLNEDFVLAENLDDLRKTITSLGVSLGIRAETEPRRFSQSLNVEVTPPGALYNVGDSGEVSFKVGIAQAGQQEGIGSVPKGDAMLGISRLASNQDWEVRMEGAEDDVPGILREVPLPLLPSDPVPVRVIQKNLRAEGLSKLDLEVMVFYRGRVDAQSRSPIAVIPRIFKDLVVVSITQDREALENKYGKNLAAQIDDQFGQHKDEGYMHQGKDLDYVLTVQNILPRDLFVKCQRSLLDAKKENPKKLDEKPLEKVLKPQEKIELRGRLTSNDVPLDNRMFLELTVKDQHGASLVDPLRVKVTQLRLEDYMKIEELTQMDEFEGQRMPCYVVRYIRKREDPVTEPILLSEMSCTIEGIVGKKVNLGEDYPIFPGQSVKTTHPRQEGATQWKWSGRIEGVDLPEKTVKIQP